MRHVEGIERPEERRHPRHPPVEEAAQEMPAPKDAQRDEQRQREYPHRHPVGEGVPLRLQRRGWIKAEERLQAIPAP